MKVLFLQKFLLPQFFQVKDHQDCKYLLGLNDRNMKYPLICHAEENAIMHAARIGVSVKGSTAYVTWPPCTRCARSLIQAGIKEIVYYSNLEIPERWIEDFNISSAMFAEAGVEVRQV